jgi:hypothetical protein
MASITLTDKQLRGMLRRERRVASRQQAIRRQTPAPAAAPGAVKYRLALPLGVDPDDDDGDDGDIEHDPRTERLSLDASSVIDQLAESNPGCLAPSGYPFVSSQAAVVAAKDPAKMSATFVVVTRQKDPNRHGNMVQIQPGPNGLGMQIEDWAMNPVVLFNHGDGAPLPVGSAMKDGELYWNAQKSKATSTCFFSQSNPDAAAIYALIDEGILRAASVQFIPTKALRLAQPKIELAEGVESLDWRGYDFPESKLIEWSVVAIGADPGAIRKSISAGRVAGQRISQRLRHTLAQDLAPQRVWTPGVDFAPTTTRALAEVIAENLRQETQSLETSVDAVAQKSTLAPVIDGNALADQFRQSIATPASQVDANAIADQVRQEIQRATSGVLEGFSKLSERVNQLAGN